MLETRGESLSVKVLCRRMTSDVITEKMGIGSLLLGLVDKQEGGSSRVLGLKSLGLKRVMGIRE